MRSDWQDDRRATRTRRASSFLLTSHARRVPVKITQVPAYRCRSHDKSDCRDVVCRRQAERAGLIAPPTAKAPRAAGASRAGGSAARTAVPSAAAAARARALAGELWLGPATVTYSSGGQVTGSTAHIPGAVCKVRGENPDATGLFEGWGRIEDTPNAVADLIAGNFVPATDGSGLMATRLCQSCKTLLG